MTKWLNPRVNNILLKISIEILKTCCDFKNKILGNVLSHLFGLFPKKENKLTKK